MKHLLIDGDGVAYSICVGVEQEIKWDDNLHTLHSRLEDCIDIFNNYLNNLKNKFGEYKATWVFSSKTNFRKTVDPTYKYHRKKTRKPLAYKSLVEYICNKFPNETWDDLEADDVLGYLATLEINLNKVIVISDDKDLLTIPGRIYRLGEMHEITQKTADYNWLCQTLTGDTADGYKGCPGIGPKAAMNILNKDCSFKAVVKAFENAGLTYDDALRQARLARILRYEDYDFEHKKVNLWEPKQESISS